MPSLYYHDALKRGQKELRACTARGEYPYLPVLEDFVPKEELLHPIDVGTILVPLEFVRGTRTSGRTQAFARNFMPLLDEDSEFASKWSDLCQSQMEEGIRDPIKAYEYMNRYYVEEGNKRVSVLKFFGADSIYAQVTRILPPQGSGPEADLYYELLDFCRYSRVNFLEFSKPGGYARLQEMLGKNPGELWSDEDRSGFSSAYYYFLQAYKACGGEHLHSTPGDALLAYLEVYGYPSLRQKTKSEVRQSLAKLWEEVALQQEQNSIAVELAPKGDESKPKDGILTRMFSKSAAKVTRVAFIHDRDPEVSGWTYGHELGRKQIQEAFSGEVETVSYFNALSGDPLEVIQQAIAEGCSVIFTTSPRLLPASLRAAVDHPEATILNCSLNTSHRYIRTYYARMYEPKFICGAVAGALAGGNHVGYICDYPIYGQVACINAFALGVQLTNPRIRVHLEWSSVGGGDAALSRLTQKGISLVSAQDLAAQGWKNARYGLSLINEEGQVNLATPVWQWGRYYEAILRRIQNGTLQQEYHSSRKALNYYWGMSSGVVGLQCSDKLPDSTIKLASILQNQLCSGSCNPFRGPLFAQGGRQVIGETEALDMEGIVNMNWLADNIVGTIPAYEELDETGKATVGIVGVEAAGKDKQK